MKKGKLTAVVAVRKGSQRIPSKNIKQFGDTNLLQLKLMSLKKISMLDEIVVNSDCDFMLNVGKELGCTTHKRDNYFASSEVNNSEFHQHIAEVTDTDFIFLAPTCSPFVTEKSHNSAIKLFLESSHDSVTSVDVIKNHLWMDNKPLNYSLDNVPNSQDLPDVKRLNYGISIITKNSMLKNRGLVGDNPGFVILDDIESIDVDWPLDFFIAEQIYEKKIKG